MRLRQFFLQFPVCSTLLQPAFRRQVRDHEYDRDRALVIHQAVGAKSQDLAFVERGVAANHDSHHTLTPMAVRDPNDGRFPNTRASMQDPFDDLRVNVVSDW